MCSHLRGAKRDSYLVPEQDTSLFFLLFPNCTEGDKTEPGQSERKREKAYIFSLWDNIHVYRKRKRERSDVASALITVSCMNYPTV